MTRILLLILAACGFANLPTCFAQDFDGTRWNLSTGNLSVQFIQASPIGAFPRPDFLEAPPSVESLKKLKAQGLVAYEDYIAWGAVEREPGKWDWRQHDAVEKAVHAAGLKYVVYIWAHFPPTWLRDQRKDDRTLMRCIEHDQETNYLSIFDPKTIEQYDHFYKNLAEHFGERIDGVYSCILGPYGEGNYPLHVPDWVNMGHCHEGFWCGDEFAKKRLTPPPPGNKERRKQVDFIAAYHLALIDFTEQSIQTTLKYFPKEKVRTKPGGNAGGVNPIKWGTYCPGYAKMASKYGIVLQPADWHGAYFGDKWVATAYHFYNVLLATEPAGGLDQNGCVKRLFSDISCGSRQLFTYEFAQHAPTIQKNAHLITGQPGETETAVLCPTTLYRLGHDLSPTIQHAGKLRDITDYDVLDELLIADGALTFDRYKLLLIFQGDYIDQPILDKLADYLRAGGTILMAGYDPPCNLEGKPWKPPGNPDNLRLVGPGMTRSFIRRAEQFKGFDGVEDGVWTTRRGGQTILFNGTDNPVTASGDKVLPRSIATTMPRVELSGDGKGFAFARSKTPFTPWGFNYDRDSDSNLLEDYWHEQWPRVVEDFAEMKRLGANVVRIHLQFGRFMEASDRPNEKDFAQFERLVHLAEETGLYLDLTGLACYRKPDVPAWYDALSEPDRWNAQARFWEEVARRCANSPAVFCYDLMNEPVAANEKQPDKQWLHPAAFGGFHFVQYIAIDPAGRSRDDIFRAWVKHLTAAIRKHDKRTPITVGMLPFAPGEVARDLDFLSVHIYPKQGKVDDELKLLKTFDYGKPIVIEEMFPMNCDSATLTDFITRSRDLGVRGWIGFYWGKTPEELKASKSIGDAMTLAWLELFKGMSGGSTRPAR